MVRARIRPSPSGCWRVDQDATELLHAAGSDVQAFLAEIGGPALLELGKRLAVQETLDGREFEAAVCDVLGAIPTLSAPQ